MSSLNLNRDELIEALRTHMWRASNKLIWGMIFLMSFVSILDFVIVPELYLELAILKLIGAFIIVFSALFLAKVQKKPLFLLHITQLTLTLMQLVSMSFVNVNGQILYLVVLAVIFVSFNSIAIWRVSDAVLQFTALCLMLFALNYFKVIDLKPLLILGGYTSLAICAVSVSFPAIKMLSLRDTIEEDISDKEEINKIKRKNADLESLLREKETQSKKIENNIKVFKHDLKNKLGSIESLAELIELENRYLMQPGQHDYLSLIKDSVSDVTESNLLKFSPTEETSGSASMNLLISNIDLHKIIENNRLKMFEILEAQNIDLKMNLQAKNSIVRLDKNLADIAIYNLLKYSVKFSKNNDSIYLNTRIDQNYIIFEIVNKTSGISMASIESHFKDISDYKLKEIQQTQGLGLSIAKNHIELLGGHLRYSSSVSLGFEFLVEFKLNERPN